MKKFLAYGFFLLCAGLFIMCSDDIKLGGDGGGQITVEMKKYDTYLHFEFVDAKTEKYLQSKDVTIKISGNDSKYIKDNFGQTESTYTTKTGMFDLVVDQEKASSADFMIVASCPGYADFSYRVRLNKSEFGTIRISMVNLSDLPKGVSKATDSNLTTTDSKGTVAQKALIDLTSGKSTIEVPEGVVLKNQSGEPVTGTIKADVLFYDPSEHQALNAFPGGLDIQAKRENGSIENISFSSAGLFDITLSSGGQTVETIEGEGLKLTTVLDPNLINPHTGKAIKEGDQIEMWSMDSETNIWKYEKMATVKKDASGDLFLQENIEHLSYWNWDWFSNACSLGAKIKFTGNAEGVSVLMKNQHPMNYYTSERYLYVDVNDSYNNNLQFQWVPQNFPTTLTFEGVGEYKDRLTFKGAKLVNGGLTIMNLCANEEYVIEVIDNEGYYQLDFDISVSSKSNNIKIKANAFFYVRPLNEIYYTPVPMVNGKLLIKAKAGVEYEIFGYFGNYYGSGRIKAEDINNKENVKVSFTPNFVYDTQDGSTPNVPTSAYEERIVDYPKSNTIKIEANIVLPDDIAKKVGIN